MEPTRLPCRFIATDQSGHPACHLVDRTAPIECPTCLDYTPIADDSERQVTEVWSRVMGYHRPVSAFNAGKQQEHRDRVLFREP